MSTQTDFKTLGRLGTANGTLMGGTLRRQSALRGGRMVRRGKPYTGGGLPSLQTVGIGAAVVLVLLFGLGLTAQNQLDSPVPAASSVPVMDPVLEASLLSGGTQMAATGSRTLIPGGGASAGMVEVPHAFGALEDLALHLPTRDDVTVIFTEADAVDDLAMAPVGTMVDNGNPDRFEKSKDFQGPDYMVGEAVTGVRPATGMARILMAPGSEVLAPLTGEVVAVDEYSSPDGGRDYRIVIQPSTRPDLQVVIRRIDAPLVSVGQTVGVGQTSLGQVRVGNPTPTDRNPLALPSVLVSVRPAIESDTVDPYAPAVGSTLASS